MRPYRNKDRRRIRPLKDGTASVKDLIGDVAKGERVCGIIAGQFSLIDIMQHLLTLSGPADVTISTWTTGLRDMARAKDSAVAGAIRSITWVVDRSFVKLHPTYARNLVELFENGNIRATSNHSKFIVIDGPHRRFVVQSSMNLNRNRRLENFDITEGDDITDHYMSLVDDILATADPGLKPSGKAAAVLDQVMTAPPQEEPDSVNFDDIFGDGDDDIFGD